MFLKGRKGCVWMQGNEQLLEVSGLETAFRIKDDYYNAVDDVSFELKKNEILAIVGESGCGKSTLLRCINGLEKIQEGDILLEDELIGHQSKQMPLIRQKIGMVFQSYELFPHMDVLHNIILGPTKAQGRDKAEAIK